MEPLVVNLFHPYTKVRTCAQCGCAFQKTWGGRNKGLFCSRPCVYEYQRGLSRSRAAAQGPAPPPERTCAVCAKVFPKVRYSTVCSLACTERRKAERRDAHRLSSSLRSAVKQQAKVAQRAARVCKGCSAAFLPSHGSSLFCSPACMRGTFKRIDKRVRR